MALSSGALVLIFFSLYVIHLGLDEVSNPRLQRSLTLGPGVVRPHPRANVLRTGQRSLVEGVAGCRCEPLPITPADQSCGNWHDSQITALTRSLGGNSCDNLLCWPHPGDNRLTSSVVRVSIVEGAHIGTMCRHQVLGPRPVLGPQSPHQFVTGMRPGPSECEAYFQSKIRL